MQSAGNTGVPIGFGTCVFGGALFAAGGTVVYDGTRFADQTFIPLGSDVVSSSYSDTSDVLIAGSFADSASRRTELMARFLAGRLFSGRDDALLEAAPRPWERPPTETSLDDGARLYAGEIGSAPREPRRSEPFIRAAVGGGGRASRDVPLQDIKDRITQFIESKKAGREGTLPPRARLVRAIEGILDSIPQEDVDDEQRAAYLRCINYMAGNQMPFSVVAAVLMMMTSADVDEGLDFMSEAHRLAAHPKKFKTALSETAEAVLAASMETPQAALSLMRLASLISAALPGQRDYLGDIADSARLLSQINPRFAADVFERLTAIGHAELARDFLRGIVSIERLHGRGSLGVLRLLEPHIRRMFLSRGAVTTDKIETYRLFARYLPLARREYLQLAIEVERTAHSWSAREGFKRFLSIADASGVGYPDAELVDRLLGFRREAGADDRARAMLCFAYEVWSAYLPPLAAARFITRPAIMKCFAVMKPQQIAVHQGGLEVYLFAPRTLRLFTAFLDEFEKRENTEAALEEYLRVFLEIAIGERYGTDPIADEIDWDDITYKMPEAALLELKEILARLKKILAVEMTQDGLRRGAVEESASALVEADLPGLISKSAATFQRPVKEELEDGTDYATLTQARYLARLVRMARELRAVGLSMETRQRIIDRIKTVLENMPERDVNQQEILKTDILLMAIGAAGLDAMEACADLSLFVAGDIREQRKGRPDERGCRFAELVLKLHAMGHAQTAQIAGLIVDEITRLPELRETSTPQKDAFDAAHAFFDIAGEVVDILPLTDDQKKFITAFKESMEQFYSLGEAPGRTAAAISEAEDIAARVDDAFFGAAGGAGEAPETLPLIAGGSAVLLTAGEGQSGEGDAARSVALQAIVSGEGASLATARRAMDVRTGLVVVRLGGGVDIPLMRAVAPLREEAGREIRTDFERRMTGTQGEAMRELDRLARERGRTDLELVVPKARDAAKAAERLSRLRDADVTATMLGRAAGDDARAKLIEALGREVSMPRGLAMIEIALRDARRDNSITIKSVDDAAVYLPDITALEVALISLCTRVPPLILERNGLVMAYQISMSGALWASDTYNPAKKRQGLHPVDPYIYMGMTAKNAGTNITPFRKEVRELLKGILRSGLTDRFFFDHLWLWNTDSVAMGLAMLKRGSAPRYLITKKVVDVGTGRELELWDIARLIGLLERVPVCIGRAHAAHIYFRPFAAGIIFVDQDGKPIEHVPYHPHLQTEAFRQVYDAVEADDSEANALMHKILGGDICATIEDVAMGQTGGELSPLERMTLEVQARYGIALPQAFRLLREASGFDDNHPLMGMPVPEASLKMGADEIGEVEGALGRLPPHVIARARDGARGRGGVRVIHKRTVAKLDYVSMTADARRFGDYDPFEKVVTIYHFRRQPYRQLGEKGRQMWRQALVHEIVGESIFAGLTPDEQVEVMAIYPWRRRGDLPGARQDITRELTMAFYGMAITLTPDMSDEDVALHFLTSYSTSSPNDLFSVAVEAYVYHGPEFRQRAEASPYLAKLYAWIRTHIFTDPKTGVGYEYSDGSPFSMEELAGEVRRWEMEAFRKKQDLELELAAASESALSRGGAISTTVDSWEATGEEERADDERSYREELSGMGFAQGYLGVIHADERTRGRNKSSSSPFERESHIGFLRASAAMAEVLGEVIDDENTPLVFDQDRRELPEGGIAEYLARLAWAMMKEEGKTRRDVLRALQGRAVRRFGIDAIDKDVVSAMIEAAVYSIAKGEKRLQPISVAMSQKMLPGQYSTRHLREMDAIIMTGEDSSLETVAKLYRYLRGAGRLRLSPKGAAATVVHILINNFGLREVHKRLALDRLIPVLDDIGDKTVSQISRETGVEAGAVDAFASIFLPRDAYLALGERSRIDMILMRLKDYLGVHERLLELYRRDTGRDEPRVAAWAAEMSRVIVELRNGGKETVEDARRILDDKEHEKYLIRLEVEIGIAGAKNKM